MDMTEFIAAKYEWSYAPCLYIVKQMFEGNNAFRAGCSGTMMYKDSDRVWGSDKPGSLSGLLSRCQLTAALIFWHHSGVRDCRGLWKLRYELLEN